MTLLPRSKKNIDRENPSYKKHLKRRHLKDDLFKRLGRAISFLALIFLIFFIGGLIYWAHDGFTRYEVTLDIPKADYPNQSQPSSFKGEKQSPRHLLSLMLVDYSFEDQPYESIFAPSWHRRLHDFIKARVQNPGDESPQSILLPLEDSLDKSIKRDEALSSFQASFIHRMKREDRLVKVFRYDFFSNSDSRDPQVAGVFAGFMTTLFLFCLTLLLSFPVAVLSALYLEEFAKPNRLTRLIEINIANLASVPSVVFGILGLAVFINLFGLPRSSSLVGGLTLSLMTLPTIIVASRSAIKSVPKSIRQAARGMGTSEMQVVLHHVFPIALPGIITGTLIALARALGETAPLLMVGMMAFIVDVPQSLLDPAAPLPVQIFSWVRNPEIGFLANASAAILVLLIFLGALNTLAIFLRGKYEHKW